MCFSFKSRLSHFVSSFLEKNVGRIERTHYMLTEARSILGVLFLCSSCQFRSCGCCAHQCLLQAELFLSMIFFLSDRPSFHMGVNLARRSCRFVCLCYRVGSLSCPFWWTAENSDSQRRKHKLQIRKYRKLWIMCFTQKFLGSFS